jgi:transposase InsO family protein
VWGLDLIGP